MRITHSTREGQAITPTAVRYDVTWCIVRPEFHGATKKVCWWLDSTFPTEATACARLKELQGPLAANSGSLAVYEVQHDDANRIAAERIVARSGGERPPFRSEIQIPSKKLKSAFAQLVRPAKPRKQRNRQSTIGFTLAIATGFACIIGLAVFFAGTNIREAADRALANRVAEAERMRTEPGRILVPRGHAMCDRFLFDNQAGNVTMEGMVRCVPDVHKPAAATFTQTWPGSKK